MHTAKVFQSGNSQAIRIPKELHTEEKEFVIRKYGKAYLLLPAEDPWYAIRQTIGTFPPDFMDDREQPSWDQQPDREEL